MINESLPKNIHDDSDFDSDFVYDGPVFGEDDSLFSNTVGHHTTNHQSSLPLSLGGLQTPHQFRGNRSICKSFPRIITSCGNNKLTENWASFL
jgi:hypothetical protein